MGWETPENLQSIASALAPGFIIMLVRKQFGVYETQAAQDKLLSYAIVSTLYLALAIPLFSIANNLLTDWMKPIISVSQSIVLPALIGLLWAWIVTNGPLDNLWRTLGLQPIHHTPNAWDYLFANIDPDAWVVITLNDGQQIAGKYGAGSFASTDHAERDLLISEVWELTDDKWELPAAPKQVLLCGRDIQAIEVLSDSIEEKDKENDDKESC